MQMAYHRLIGHIKKLLQEEYNTAFINSSVAIHFVLRERLLSSGQKKWFYKQLLLLHSLRFFLLFRWFLYV